MYGEKLPVLTLSSPKKKKSFERRVGRADKGFVRNPDRCRVYPHVSIRAVFPNSRVTLRDLVRDWKVTLLGGTIILARIPKLRRYWLKFPLYADGMGSRSAPIFFATLKTATLIRNGGARHRNRDAIGCRSLRFVQRKSNANCHRSILPRG